MRKMISKKGVKCYRAEASGEIPALCYALRAGQNTESRNARCIAVAGGRTWQMLRWERHVGGIKGRPS